MESIQQPVQGKDRHGILDGLIPYFRKLCQEGLPYSIAQERSTEPLKVAIQIGFWDHRFSFVIFSCAERERLWLLRETGSLISLCGTCITILLHSIYWCLELELYTSTVGSICIVMYACM